MAGGSKGAQQGGSTTTTQAPYAPYLPYIGTALGQAGNLLQGGGPDYYPGQQVASFNPTQQNAMQGITGMNTSGLNAANKFDKTLLNGGATNPYEDQMFDKAAQATQNQMSSQFAGGGMDVGAGSAVRGDQLNNLATGIYGGQYQNNMQNALQAGNQVQSLYNTKLGGQQAALGVGNQVQQQGQNLIDASKAGYDYNQQQPYKNLGAFESFLSGVQPGSQTSNPFFTNPTANTLGTALAGQQLYNGYNSKGSKGGQSGPGGLNTLNAGLNSSDVGAGLG